MSSNQSEKSHKNACSPTDFRDFIDSIQGANAVGDRFLASMAPYRPQGILLLATEVQTAQRGIMIIGALLERRRDLDAHYGWVLASDAALVYKSMEGNGENGAEWARQWMEAVYNECEQVGQALLATKLELETLVRRVESECKS